MLIAPRRLHYVAIRLFYHTKFVSIFFESSNREEKTADR
jgi:hypothetical protein